MLFQTHMLFFVLWNTKGSFLKNLHTAIFKHVKFYKWEGKNKKRANKTKLTIKEVLYILKVWSH